MKSVLLNRFMMLGAVVPANNSAGLEVALTTRCNAFTGIANSEPACHSKVCFLSLPSAHTSVVPRPSTTKYCSSYRCFSTFNAPAPGTSTTYEPQSPSVPRSWMKVPFPPSRFHGFLGRFWTFSTPISRKMGIPSPSI